MTDNPRPVCPKCGAEGRWELCAKCGDRLRKDLDQLPALLGQLNVTLTRQSRMGSGAGSSDSPMPFDVGASNTLAEVSNTLSTLVRELDLGDTLHLADNPRAWSLWLRQRLERIKIHEGAGQFAKDVDDVVRKIHRAIDRPADGQFIGNCPTCGQGIYAPERAKTAVCGKCKRAGVDSPEWDVQISRDDMLTDIKDRLATKWEILGAIGSMYGVTVNDDTFKSWVKRDQLLPKGATRIVDNADGKAVERELPLYRIGDVTELAAQMVGMKHKGATRHKRGA